MLMCSSISSVFQSFDMTSVHGKKKYAAGHMDQLLTRAGGPHQKLPVRTLLSDTRLNINKMNLKNIDYSI